MLVSYRRINNLSGLLVFCIAATVYCLTIEPTASFWDCGEFIVSAYKLEVGHPPGAPFFMLTANVFTQLTSDPALAARMVNYMSAIMSAATILLLFFTITHLTRKLITKEHTPTKAMDILTIIASGTVGALAYTFSDTFWFSAVEGEVYAYSSLFTALVFWLMLKWEEEADEVSSDRWLILIAYLTGLSIGVHLLNLLCLPAIVLVYYYRKSSHVNIKGTFCALAISMFLLLGILYGIIPGIVLLGGWFELLFVNQFQLPFNSGLIVFLLLLAGILIWGICKCTTRVLNTSLLCLAMILIGYSSYAVIMIRSSANTPMDQNSPEDIFTLGSYLARDQYGQRPLFYGQSFSSERKLKVEDGYCSYEFKEGAPVYIRKVKDSSDEKDSYTVSGHAVSDMYAQNMLFPRMYSKDHANYGSNQTNVYRQWVDIKGHNVPFNRCGEMIDVNMPTQWENFKFFISYQLNFMYWRYFLWNFAGRQNDIQGQGELEHGNWITGISFIDTLLVGDQQNIPTELKTNKGRNVFYGLPLLLGIIGLMWQVNRGNTGKQSFLIVFFLFLMTGIAIVVYLNQTPMQVRERDYAYAGSFYAFAIWIGMGVAGMIHFLKKKLKEGPANVLASVACLCIPIQMATQTWDDHDRSGRYSCRDFGRNYLMSAPEGNYPIICTQADNDTFPLWYNQEIEGFRTDARTCNLSYLQIDWYIDQMRRDAYNGPALPITWERKEYVSGTPEALPIRPEMKKHIDTYYQNNPEQAKVEFGENPYELKNILRNWVRSDNKNMQVIPTDSLVIKLDKEAIVRSGTSIPDSLSGEIPEYMHISLKDKRYLTKRDLIMLEVISNCNWERPVYIATTVGPDAYICFENNFCQEGLLYRITPFDTRKLNARMDSEKTYDCLMNRFKWGGTESPNLYLDETTRRMYAGSRRIFASLANLLINEGKPQKALNALDHCTRVIPAHYIPSDYQSGSPDIAGSYYRLGEKEKADAIMNALAGKSVEYITWYLSMGKQHWNRVSENCLYHLYLLNEENKLMEAHDSELREHYSRIFEELYETYNSYRARQL